MDVLVPSKITKLFNPCLNVVPSDGFTLVDRIEVNRVLNALVSVDDFLRDVEPEISLRPEHGDPVFTL